MTIQLMVKRATEASGSAPQSDFANMKRRVIEVHASWRTASGQKQRARRIASMQAKALSASVGEAMISKQMARRENEQVRNDGA